MLRLEARDVSKTFGPAKVLHEFAVDVEPGEIHALIGENGSGKSTVVKILTGYHAPDPGASVAVDGTLLPLPVRWRTAAEHGVSVVHQDLGLLDELSVADNIGIGSYERSAVLRRIDWKAQRAVAARILERLGADLDPAATVGTLRPMHQAEVAIARALRHHTPGSGLIILDEATRALPREELARFHALLRRVVSEGTSVLLVSHNLPEVLTVADRVTVLRDGRVAAASSPVDGTTEHDLAALMLGKAVGTLSPRPAPVAKRPVAARISNLSDKEIGIVDFEIGRGEIVGLTGLPGTGFEAIPYLISGARRPSSGTLETPDGAVDLPSATVAQCMAAGVSLVPENRAREGLALELPVRDNLVSASIRQGRRRWFVSKRWQDQVARAGIERLNIVAQSPAMLVKELSGGNQQKVLFAKWISVKPSLLVLHEATQAVDVGARHDLLSQIQDAADAGTAVMFASSEPSDLAAICDRVLVFTPPDHLVEHRGLTAEKILDSIYDTTTVGILT
jgi:ribose transport system ATP-binding protein